MATLKKVQVPDIHDDLDLQIAHALQIHPRAPWSLLGEVLNVDAVTVARRWARLTAHGLAWVTAYPQLANSGNVISAVIEVETDAGTSQTVARELMRDPQVVTVKHTAGARDLLLTVHVTGLQALADHVAGRIAAIPAVRATRTHVVTLIAADGTHWQLRSLDNEQRDRLRRAVLPVHVGPVSPWQEPDRQLLSLLSTDGRMPVRKLAERTQLSAPTIRRRLDTLIGSRITLRCDLSRSASGWPVSATYFASVPARYLQETSGALASVQEVRSCAVVAGPHNLIIDVWLRNLADVYALEAHLSSRLPRLTVHDRSVVLSTVKHMGRLLDGEGRSVGVVAADLWSGLG
jgi:DNA-binding Lrp family transcriptional regulator